MAQQIQGYSPARDTLVRSTIAQGNGGMRTTSAPELVNGQDGSLYTNPNSEITHQESLIRQKGQAAMLYAQDRLPQQQAAAVNALEAQDAAVATQTMRADELKNGYVSNIMLAAGTVSPGFGNATMALSDAQVAAQAKADAAAQKLMAFASPGQINA